MDDAELKAEMYDQLSRVAKALSSGRRLHLLELIAQREQSVDDLARLSGVGVTTVSSHLQVLKRAGLVLTRRERTSVYYRLAGPEVAALIVQLKRVGSGLLPDVGQAWRNFTGDTGQDVVVVDSRAMADLRARDAVILDVRPRNEFEAGHFPGAVSIPLPELRERLTELPPGQPVVVYCRSEFCKMARQAARMLRGRGVDAAVMDEGVLEWRASGEVDLDEIA